MRYLMVSVMMGVSVAGCGGMNSPMMSLGSSTHPIAKASATCRAKPQAAGPIKAGDDVVVDNAKLRRIVGADVDGWSACQSYIHRIGGA